MSYSKEHVLLTWGGTLPGSETWTNSLRCAPMPIVPGAVFIDDGDLEGLEASYVPAVKDFHARLGTKIANVCQLTWVKLAAIGTDGKYKPGAISVRESVFAPIAGAIAGGGNGVPNQLSLAVTTVTALPRGHAHAGRFYLPMPSIPIGSDALISTSDADAVRQSVKTFLEAVADVPGVDTDISPTPVVMSKIGSGATNKIIGCKIGRVLDTQRRRRRSLPENYRIVDIDTGVF